MGGLFSVGADRADLVDAGLPRRLSARRSDPHFDEVAAKLSDRIDVLVDGKALEWATAWDVDAGEVIVHALDARGNMILERGAPTFKTLRGRVEVRWIKGETADA